MKYDEALKMMEEEQKPVEPHNYINQWITQPATNGKCHRCGEQRYNAIHIGDDPRTKKITDEQRYREALQHIANVLRPVNKHVRESVICDGCLYDWEEAFITAQNALDGIEEQYE